MGLGCWTEGESNGNPSGSVRGHLPLGIIGDWKYTLLKSCHGPATVDRETSTVRLIHATLQHPPHLPGSLPQPSSYHSRSVLGIFKFSISSASSMRRCSYPINTPTFYPRLLIFRDPCQKDSQSLWNPLQSKFWKYALSMQLRTFLVKRESERALAHSPPGSHVILRSTFWGRSL